MVTAEKRAELKATDASLIDRIVQRDESALAALYDRYAGMLSSVLNRILRDTQAAGARHRSQLGGGLDLRHQRSGPQEFPHSGDDGRLHRQRDERS